MKQEMNETMREVLEFHRKNDIREVGIRETARRLNITNPQTVLYYLKKIEKQGWLYFDPKTKKREPAKNKAFTVDKYFNIPVVGSANCGPAMELALEDIQAFLKISKKLMDRSTPDGLIAVKAVGESLNKAKLKGGSIENGDYVIVDCRKQPKNGDYVLSVIDGAANFKRFFKDKEEIRLVSESTSDIPPIVLHEEDVNTSGYMVNGVVVRVVKN